MGKIVIYVNVRYISPSNYNLSFLVTNLNVLFSAKLQDGQQNLACPLFKTAFPLAISFKKRLFKTPLQKETTECTLEGIVVVLGGRG